MKSFLAVLLPVLLAFGGSSSGQTDSQTEDYPNELMLFIDLDGDGINDNARDRDSDGIPDVFGAGDSDSESDLEVAGVDLMVNETSTNFGMEGVFENPQEESSAESNFAKYAEYEFATRDLKKDRGGFDSDRGVEGTASRAKICIGGVCF